MIPWKTTTFAQGGQPRSSEHPARPARPGELGEAELARRDAESMSDDGPNGVEVIAGDRVLRVWLGPPPSVDGGERSEAAPPVEKDAMGAALVANRGYVRFALQPDDCPGKETAGIAALLVKSSINPRIHRNSHRLVILYNYSPGIEFIDGGFVRIIFAVFPRGLIPWSRFATAMLKVAIGIPGGTGMTG